MWLTAPLRVVWTALTGDHAISTDVGLDGDAYVVRAALPGIDPARQVQVAIVDGELRILAEHNAGGLLAHRLPLPVTACADNVHAHYADGVLEVRIGLDTAHLPGIDVPIELDGPDEGGTVASPPAAPGDATGLGDTGSSGRAAGLR